MSYHTIDMAPTTQRSTGQGSLAAAACVFGFFAGLAIVSYRTPGTELHVSAATRGIQLATASMAAPTKFIQAHAASSTAGQSSLVQLSAAGESAESSQSVFFPAVLISSAVALALSAVKMLSSSGAKQTAMMTTTSVKREWAAQSGKKYKSVQPIIAPSLLAADLANLAADSKRVLEAGADVLHVDVMDGHFVPNLSWGAPVIKCLRQHTNAFFDTHLMVSNPEDFIAPMADAGVDQFTFHIEAAKDPKALIKAIKDAGMKVGISVKPKTPIDVVYPYVEDVDLILVMTVEPGFGGQSFMEDMMPKVKALREKYPNLDIQVDGGLGPKTIDAAAKAGANAIVAGSSCFVADPKAPIDAMRESVEKYCTGPGL